VLFVSGFFEVGPNRHSHRLPLTVFEGSCILESLLQDMRIVGRPREILEGLYTKIATQLNDGNPVSFKM